MSEQERLAAYQKALLDAAQTYGYDIGAQVAPRMVGPQLQVEAQLVISPLPNWKPLESPAQPEPAKD